MASLTSTAGIVVVVVGGTVVVVVVGGTVVVVVVGGAVVVVVSSAEFDVQAAASSDSPMTHANSLEGVRIMVEG
jgi:hypothetical protein